MIAAWREKGLKIATYKKGPDYIDAGWLSSAAGQPCYNLDPFLVSKGKILSSFAEHYKEADCAVIEGNRGLYDGMDSAGTFSTAELSRLLKCPVILILDCTKVTRTAGAIILGMQKFDKRVDIRGVVLNRIAGSRHEKIVTEAIEKYCGIPVVGSIPKLGNELLLERHMGLTPSQEHPDVKKSISFTAQIARKYLDLERILKIAQQAKPLPKGRNALSVIRNESRKKPPYPSPPLAKVGIKGGVVRIGIIRDSAFQFYYPENFEELQRRGAELVEISALKQKQLPDIDALYIGGGFPETNAIALAKNKAFRNSVKKAIENGLPVYAECGGLMYLGKALVLGGKEYPMTDVFPVKFSLERKPQAHGYTIVEVNKDNPFYLKGVELKGHEFHYSKVIELGHKKGMSFSFKMKRGVGIRDKMDAICYKNALATYTHLHAYGAPEWAEGLIRKALEYRKGSC